MITSASLDEATREALLTATGRDRETIMLMMAQADACHMSELEITEGLARIRRNLLASLAVFAEGRV